MKQRPRESMVLLLDAGRASMPTALFRIDGLQREPGAAFRGSSNAGAPPCSGIAPAWVGALARCFT